MKVLAWKKIINSSINIRGNLKTVFVFRERFLSLIRRTSRFKEE
jgi:hypothetical protein